jgi:hypothetical protein
MYWGELESRTGYLLPLAYKPLAASHSSVERVQPEGAQVDASLLWRVTRQRLIVLAVTMIGSVDPSATDTPSTRQLQLSTPSISQIQELKVRIFRCMMVLWTTL